MKTPPRIPPENGISAGSLQEVHCPKAHPVLQKNPGKGLKSADTIKIEGGTMQIDSADDSLHSNNAVYISGGTIKAESR